MLVWKGKAEVLESLPKVTIDDLRAFMKTELGRDRLVVGLNSDASVKRLKGESRPIQGDYPQPFQQLIHNFSRLRRYVTRGAVNC